MVDGLWKSPSGVQELNFAWGPGRLKSPRSQKRFIFSHTIYHITAKLSAISTLNSISRDKNATWYTGICDLPMTVARLQSTVR